jgi:hypothetical protein
MDRFENQRLCDDATTHTSPARIEATPGLSGARWMIEAVAGPAPLTIAQALAGLVEVRQAFPLAGKCALNTASYGICIAMQDLAERRPTPPFSR